MALTATQSTDSIKWFYLNERMDGWMEGWMDLDKKSGIIILDNVPEFTRITATTTPQPVQSVSLLAK
jgi:hypothetical protein